MATGLHTTEPTGAHPDLLFLAPVNEPSSDRIIEEILRLMDGQNHPDIGFPPDADDAWWDEVRAAVWALAVPRKLSKIAEYLAELYRACENRPPRESEAASVAISVLEDEITSSAREAEDVKDIEARLWWLEQPGNWDLACAEGMVGTLRRDLICLAKGWQPRP